jgi:fumarate hydratase, class II
MQDATPLTLGQAWSGYAGILADHLDGIETALPGVHHLAPGGTATGTGINSAPRFAGAVAAEIAKLTGLPWSRLGTNSPSEALTTHSCNYQVRCQI